MCGVALSPRIVGACPIDDAMVPSVSPAHTQTPVSSTEVVDIPGQFHCGLAVAGRGVPRRFRVEAGELNRLLAGMGDRSFRNEIVEHARSRLGRKERSSLVHRAVERNRGCPAAGAVSELLNGQVALVLPQEVQQPLVVRWHVEQLRQSL